MFPLQFHNRKVGLITKSSGVLSVEKESSIFSSLLNLLPFIEEIKVIEH